MIAARGAPPAVWSCLGAAGIGWVLIWTCWAIRVTPGDGRAATAGEVFDAANLVVVQVFAVGVAAAVRQLGVGRAPRLIATAYAFGGFALMFAGYFDLYPLFILGGVLMLVSYAILVGGAFVRGAVPWWLVVLIVASMLSFLAMSSDSARAWCALPLGVGWVLLAWTLRHPPANWTEAT